MSRFYSYLQSATLILSQYKGDVPFAIFIKKYFSTNKKYGSRDRKEISAICYQYFRVCNAVSLDVRGKIIAGAFLCNSSKNALLDEIAPELNEKVELLTEDKLRHLLLEPKVLFKFSEWLSNEIDANKYGASMLLQPDVFLRIRPGKEAVVEQKLSAHNISFHKVKDDILRLPQSVNLQDIIRLHNEAVIQDLQSAQVLDTLPGLLQQPRPDVWDCCAASGGKSILLYDKLNRNLKLTATDIRKSILHNLRMRLSQAGVNLMQIRVVDLLQPIASMGTFDLIVCDAPCSGSGTWSRTPEQMQYFSESDLNNYVSNQKRIVMNTFKHLKPGGIFFYITCSVFEKENEGIAKYIQEEFKLECLQQAYLKGYETRSDTMFYAVFKS